MNRYYLIPGMFNSASLATELFQVVEEDKIGFLDAKIVGFKNFASKHFHLTKLVSALVKNGYVPLYNWGCLIPTDTHPTCNAQPLRIHIIIQSVHMHPCGLYGFD